MTNKIQILGLILVLGLSARVCAETEILISTDDAWRFKKGTSEASNPTNLWRETDFDDSSWAVAPTPLHYGTNAVGGDDELTGGTILNDMQDNYSCIFLRKTIVVNTNNLDKMEMATTFDDGWIAWMNGQQVRVVLVRSSDIAYDSTAFRPLPEATATTNEVVLSQLQQGTNVLCVQAFNYRITDEDFRFAVQLSGSYPDVAAPEVASADPAAGSSMINLNEITVTFSEPVSGVTAQHFLVNGVPASTVSGSGAVYTYSFAQPAPGAVQIQFHINHTITDLIGNRLNELAPSSTWSYTLIDGSPPIVLAVNPAESTALTSLTQIQVEFDEPVTGVDAGDLLLNGQPVLSVIPVSASTYLFEFNSPPVGSAVVAWDNNHEIFDTATVPNAFIPNPATWSYIIVPDSDPTVVVVPMDANWSYHKGRSEASTPTNAWRDVGFDASSWTTGDAPFHFGKGLDEGTELDMRLNPSYTTVFLRQEFNLDTNGILNLKLKVNYDDGIAVWINGQLIDNRRVADNQFAYDDRAISFVLGDPEAGTIEFPVTALRSGVNAIAIQGFDFPFIDADFFLEAELTAFYPDIVGPKIFSVSPEPGSTISNLTEITVAFDEEVTGVEAGDFLINGGSATSVSGADNVYTYSFTEPVAGPVTIQWDQDHTLSDTNGNYFDHTAPSASWGYTLVDGTPPTLISTTPTPGTTVASLSQIRLEFSEAVAGLDANDLRINGQPAISAESQGGSTYLFTFNAVPDGPADVTWNPAHGIEDFAIPANPFVAAPWSHEVDSTAIGEVVINEISALWYSGSLLDEDGEANDWIELRNRSLNEVSLNGWSLTTDRTDPGMWKFPNVTLAPGEYRLVFASAKDRKPTTPNGELHANFRLNQFGEYLALYQSELPPIVVSEYDPFPEQRQNISYGFDASNQLAYFPTNAVTPGAPNPNSGTALGVVDMDCLKLGGYHCRSLA